MRDGTSSLKANTVEPRTIQLERVVIGKDVLELVSSAMYVDPLTIYREYVQNAADAIDEAREAGVIGDGEKGHVSIDLDSAQRRVVIRDNGIGVKWAEFGARLSALGASAKRGRSARGFRGVGRLAGLGYTQRLTFRSRTAGEEWVSELSWDCRLLRSVLRSNESDTGIEDLIRRAVSLRQVEVGGFPERFFEVELDGVVRLRSDKLMSPAAISEYLAQVAPVPFAPEFPFANQIQEALLPTVKLDGLELTISGIEKPVCRPHQRVVLEEKKKITFEDIELFTIPDVDGGPAAVGWILHHEYDGAVPTGTGFKGMRLRAGNVQIGGNSLLEELFTEPRFNSWSIGEVHILDRRIIPNARRDDFEQNAHYNNLLNQLTPFARAISKRCRTSSKERQHLRDFDLQEQGVKERLKILAQGGIRKDARRSQVSQIETAFGKMRRLANLQDDESDKARLLNRVARLEERSRLEHGPAPNSPLELLPAHKRGVYGQVIELIYECSANRIAATSLVDRILEKIASPPSEKLRKLRKSEKKGATARTAKARSSSRAGTRSRKVRSR